jgi:hypothetical protein
MLHGPRVQSAKERKDFYCLTSSPELRSWALTSDDGRGGAHGETEAPKSSIGSGEIKCKNGYF